MEKFDVAVIGGGPGGYPAAIRAAQLGASVALVEKERVGGTCLNWGCIPTKALIASAELCHRARHAAALGVRVGSVAPDYPAMWRRKNGVVEKLRGGVETLLKGNGVKVFEGTGSFAARDRVAVSGPAGHTLIEAKRTIVATGSESAVPGFIPASPRVVESRAFLDLQALPPSLIVLGGGVIGCEFACMAAQIGAKVTVVELLEDILIALDKDVRQTLRRHMEEALGIRVLTGKPLEAIAAGKDGVAGKFGDEPLQADMLLVSVGRKPVTRGLDSAKAGAPPTEKGFLAVDEYCRTRAATVYAIGDVTEGSTLLAHAATAQGLAAAENAVGRRPVKAERLVPACIYTSPEIGSVGLSEDKAKAAGRNVRIGKFPFAALGRALAADDANGFVKWVADADSDQLLGAHAVGAHATELIAEAALAVRSELTLDEVGRTVHCHPTFSEAWMEAAHAAHGQCIHAAPKRRR
jgi:dihydrolipoamide dehydrogenase